MTLWFPHKDPPVSHFALCNWKAEGRGVDFPTWIPDEHFTATSPGRSWNQSDSPLAHVFCSLPSASFHPISTDLHSLLYPHNRIPCPHSPQSFVVSTSNSCQHLPDVFITQFQKIKRKTLTSTYVPTTGPSIAKSVWVSLY